MCAVCACIFECRIYMFCKKKKKHACTVRPGPLVVFENKVSWLRKEHVKHSLATGCESDRVDHWPGLVAYVVRDRRSSESELVRG